MSDYEYTIDQEYLEGVISKELDAADSWMESDLEQEQADNLKYYYGEPFGNEKDGFSQVVTRDVLETVEGIMPELMKIFAGTDQVVEFDPVGPQDEEKVEIEARYINHVFMNRASGYKVLYDWFKDALIMKNGYIKVEWDDCEEVQFREFAGLTEEEFKFLEEGQESEDPMLFATEYEIEDYEQDEDDSYRVRLKITRMRGRPVVCNIPAENFRIRERSTSIQDSDFVAHVIPKTIGELIEDGYDEDDVYAATRRHWDTTLEDARFRNPDEPQFYPTSQGRQNTEVDFVEAYVRCFDPADDRVKLFKCHYVDNNVLDWMEVDRIPIISLSPIMMPHKHTGLAVADLVRDIQEIRSAIMRQVLDNLALQNAGRWSAIEGQVNLQDAINNKIGGIVRMKMPGAFSRLDTPDLSAHTIPVLEQLYMQKEDRTGVSRMTAGVDENALSSHQTATAVNMVMTAAQSKILLIARNFAETGVKELFLELYNLIREYQTKPDLVPISGRYAIVNPEEWIDRHDIHVTVGIGRGNKDAQLMHLQGISQMLQMIGQTPYGYLITAENAFNFANEFIKNSGYDNAVKFISHPSTVQPPEPQPDPLLIDAQSNAQLRGAQAQKTAVEAELLQPEFSLKTSEFDWQKKVDAAELATESVQERPVGIGDGK